MTTVLITAVLEVPGGMSWASLAETAGPGVAVALDLLVVLAAAAVYLARTAWIRFAHRRERGCANPLHRAEASTRGAVAQTALTLGAAAAVLAGLPVPWLVPAELLHGWAGLAIGAPIGLLIAVGVARWRTRREHQLGLTDQACWL